MKNIVLLGSTGSIGTQTLEVIRANPDFNVLALAVNANVDKLFDQILQFYPRLAVVYEEEKAFELKKRLEAVKTDARHTEILSGMDGLMAAASMEEADIVLQAVVGMIGIRPTLKAIECGKDIALANKETLVTAGHLIMPAVKKAGVNLFPVDSEHSAIFQVLQGQDLGGVDRILLTASGGPFRGRKKSELRNVRPADALSHPTWSMGRKITIDSSTLVNKGLEVMEASWLFNVPAERVTVVVQPQSVIHSMVQFKDGAVLAQLGTPDMRLPIQYALSYPNRRYLEGERLDFSALSKISFEEPDTENFPGLRLAYEAAKAGGSMPTVYNAANEAAVGLFLSEKIGYLAIAELIESCMLHHQTIKNPDLDTILQVEKEVRNEVLTRKKDFRL